MGPDQDPTLTIKRCTVPVPIIYRRRKNMFLFSTIPFCFRYRQEKQSSCIQKMFPTDTVHNLINSDPQRCSTLIQMCCELFFSHVTYIYCSTQLFCIQISTIPFPMINCLVVYAENKQTKKANSWPIPRVDGVNSVHVLVMCVCVRGTFYLGNRIHCQCRLLASISLKYCTIIHVMTNLC